MSPSPFVDWTVICSLDGHGENRNRADVFHTMPGETIMDEEHSILIEHPDDMPGYVITIGPLAHVIPIWRQWTRWEVGE